MDIPSLIVTPDLTERTLIVDPADLAEQDVDARAMICFTTRPFGKLADWSVLVYVDEERRVIRRLKVWCFGLPDLDADALCNLARMSWRFATRELEKQLQKEETDGSRSCEGQEAPDYEVPWLLEADDDRHRPFQERLDADREVPLSKL